MESVIEQVVTIVTIVSIHVSTMESVMEQVVTIVTIVSIGYQQWSL